MCNGELSQSFVSPSSISVGIGLLIDDMKCEIDSIRKVQREEIMQTVMIE